MRVEQNKKVPQASATPAPTTTASRTRSEPCSPLTSAGACRRTTTTWFKFRADFFEFEFAREVRIYPALEGAEAAQLEHGESVPHLGQRNEGGAARVRGEASDEQGELGEDEDL